MRSGSLKVEVALFVVAGLVALAAIGWVVVGRPAPSDRDLGPDPFAPGEAVSPTPAVQDVDLAGAKILEGAERAFKADFHETAAKFYLDFDLRYAGTTVYERRAPEVWERLRLCYAAMGQSGEAVDKALAARRSLHDRWPRMSEGEATAAELKAYLAELPAGDGRRPRIEKRIAEAR